MILSWAVVRGTMSSFFALSAIRHSAPPFPSASAAHQLHPALKRKTCVHHHIISRSECLKSAPQTFLNAASIDDSHIILYISNLCFNPRTYVQLPSFSNLCIYTHVQ